MPMTLYVAIRKSKAGYEYLDNTNISPERVLVEIRVERDKKNHPESEKRFPFVRIATFVEQETP